MDKTRIKLYLVLGWGASVVLLSKFSQEVGGHGFKVAQVWVWGCSVWMCRESLCWLEIAVDHSSLWLFGEKMSFWRVSIWCCKVQTAGLVRVGFCRSLEWCKSWRCLVRRDEFCRGRWVCGLCVGFLGCPSQAFPSFRWHWLLGNNFLRWSEQLCVAPSSL